MKKLLITLSFATLIFSCKKEEKEPELLPVYEYEANGVMKYNEGNVSVATIDSATQDTLIFIYDGQNSKQAVLLRFNGSKQEGTIGYNDTTYKTDVIAFIYREEKERLHGRFSFNAFNGFKFVEVKKGKFENIEIK